MAAAVDKVQMLKSTQKDGQFDDDKILFYH